MKKLLLLASILVLAFSANAQTFYYPTSVTDGCCEECTAIISVSEYTCGGGATVTAITPNGTFGTVLSVTVNGVTYQGGSIPAGALSEGTYTVSAVVSGCESEPVTITVPCCETCPNIDDIDIKYNADNGTITFFGVAGAISTDDFQSVNLTLNVNGQAITPLSANDAICLRIFDPCNPGVVCSEHCIGFTIPENGKGKGIENRELED